MSPIGICLKLGATPEQANGEEDSRGSNNSPQVCTFFCVPNSLLNFRTVLGFQQTRDSNELHSSIIELCVSQRRHLISALMIVHITHREIHTNHDIFGCKIILKYMYILKLSQECNKN